MDYERAAGFWLEKDAGAKRMGRDALKSEAEKYILSHNTCALAAASGGFVRCTPMEYTYRDGSFWLFSEGGLKHSPGGPFLLTFLDKQKSNRFSDSHIH